MKKFEILANDYLSQNITAFYHEDYTGGMGLYRQAGTIEHLICSFKNDITKTPDYILQECKKRLSEILETDIPQIIKQQNLHKPMICVIPRAKTTYRPDQLQFKATVQNAVSKFADVQDGTECIQRIINTRTTHRNHAGYGGDGNLPYPGITNDTCKISNNVIDKDIILIDDLYTKTINIDEDAIQALLNHGAKSVIFYAIGHTVCRY